MKQLRDAPPVFEIPDAEDLLAEVSWLKNVDHSSFHKIAKKFESKIYNKGDVLLHEDKVEDGMYIIVRGSIKITIKGELIDLLGPGNTIGEVAALNKNKRTATVTAETPITVLWISSKSLKQLVSEYKEIGEQIWHITAIRYAYYLLKDISPFDKLSKNQFKKELKKGSVALFKESEKIDLSNKTAILINGTVTSNNKEIQAPAILKNESYTINKEARIFTNDELS
ncbi:cyclic nucleotide-binding domain-containing protein [Vicingaceae bacterium]|nr:cyclic nucleotide-binding domain-containing protein [Vicingaceae bacterium]